MADLFSDEWMKTFMTEWNNEPALAVALQKISFNSVTGYGFQGDAGKITELIFPAVIFF